MTRSGRDFCVFIARAIATAGGSGFSPYAPGTAGTLVTIPIVYLLAPVPLIAYVGITLALLFIGVWASNVADRSWATDDCQRIVIDEVVGYMLTMTWVDRSHPLLLAIGFVVFRALDIGKPFPIRLLDEKVGGGWGVMLDDVAAGAIGSGLLFLAARSDTVMALWH